MSAWKKRSRSATLDACRRDGILGMLGLLHDFVGRNGSHRAGLFFHRLHHIERALCGRSGPGAGVDGLNGKAETARKNLHLCIGAEYGVLGGAAGHGNDALRNDAVRGV